MKVDSLGVSILEFPISRDPPEGGTNSEVDMEAKLFSFQFLGIPPKGERAV